MPLNWQDASRSHYADLQAFTCAYPPRYSYHRILKRKFHEKPWQMVVQTGLHKIKPPVGPPRRMLLGYDGEILAGVAIFEPRGMDPESGQFYIRAVARANNYRREGVASQLLAEVLNQIAETGATGVMCDIDHRNTPSQRLFRAHGFECLGANPEDSSLEVWAVRINEPTEHESPETGESES